MNDLRKDILDGSSDIMEFGIDLITKNEILREFPLLGTIIKIGLSVKSLSDRAFLKKIEKFLLKLDEVSKKEKDNVIIKIQLDDKQRKSIGENLFFLIDRFSDRQKPEFLALYLKGEINYEDFVRLGNAIDLSFSPDLENFLKESNNQLNLGRLVRTGLVEVSKVGVTPAMQIGSFDGLASIHSLIITDIGWIFLKLKDIF